MDKYLTSFDPFSIVRDVLKHWFTILITAAAVSMLYYVWLSYTYVPEYTTSTTFVVTEKAGTGDVLTSLKSAEETAQRFVEVLDGSLLKKAVKEGLELEEFTARTHCSLIPSTNMVTLTVTAGTAYESFLTMKSILKNYPSVSDYLVGSVYLEVMEQPALPTAPSNRINMRHPMTLSFMGVAIFLIAVIGFFSYNRDTVKNYAQFNDKVDAYSCGVIFHERKSGKKHVSRIGYYISEFFDIFFRRPDKSKKEVSMLIDNPTRSFRYVESSKMVAASVRARMDLAKAKVLLVTSVTENEGKSTVAANIALSLAEEGKTVLLIDADYRKPSQHLIFGLDEDRAINFSKYLGNKGAKIPRPARYKNSLLLIMANNYAFDNADSSHVQENMKRVVDFFKKKMDYVILDSAPMGLISDTESIASLADRSLLVVREDMVLAPHINDIIDELSKSGAPVAGAVFSDATPRKIGGSDDVYSGYGGSYGTR